jgi:phage-related protein
VFFSYIKSLMGWLGKMFRKIGGGIKKAINWVKDKVAPTVRKIIPIAKPLVGLIPGVGPAIQKGIELGEHGAGMIDKLANGSSADRKNILKDGLGMLTNRMGMAGGAGPKIM